MNYATILADVADKKCILTWTENDFKEKYKDTKSMINIISSCGHETTVQSSNFFHKDTGIICKKCIFKQFSDMTLNIPNDNHLQEYQVIKALQTYCKDLKFKISVEGCLADFAIKPINEPSDIWLPIQMKTTKSISHGIYGFMIRQYYKNMFIILFSIEDQRIWLLNGNDVMIYKINIGNYHSIYSQYEIGSLDLVSNLTHNYYNFKDYLKTLDEINIPRSPQAVQEQHFNRYREKLFQNLVFNYPEIDGSVYDCIINNAIKIQDKIITCYYKKSSDKSKNRNSESWMVHLQRRRKYCKISYKLGDNDYYWLHLPDKKGAYIIPEQILYDKKYISKVDEDLKPKSLLLYPYYSEQQLKSIKNAWINDYLYIYDKNNTKQQIERLFDNKELPNIITEYISPIVIIDKENPEFINIKKIIHELVITIFDNVISYNKTIKNCSSCDEHISKDNISGLCRICYGKGKFLSAQGRKVERPPYKQLLEEVKTLNYSGTGRKYGVSDSAIRKWIKTYEKYI